MISKSDLKNIKLIVFDLDGTLLNSKDQVGNETQELISKLQEKGVTFSFASGRLHGTLMYHAEKLNIKTPLISLDGALVKSIADNRYISENFIPARYVRKAMAVADELLLSIALCHSETIYYTEHNSTIPHLMDKFGAKYEEVHSYDDYIDETLELVMVSDYKDNTKQALKRLSFPYTFGLNTGYYKSSKHEEIYYIEVRRKGVSKGTGLKKLCRYLKTGITETAVMGDWYNDRTLFETKAIKVAVANAVPEIKRLADFITKRTNEEDAAAEFLKMVLDAKNKWLTRK